MRKEKILTLFFSVLLFFLKTNYVFAEDSLSNAIKIATKSMDLESKKITVATENIANADSKARTPGGDPYRRKIIFTRNKYNKKLNVNLVEITKYGLDNSKLRLKFDPYHPGADASGYVKLPNVNTHIEKSDIAEAERVYEASLGVIKVSRSMMQKTIEAIK